eukprot:2046881-Rhodomonas_salina.1
MVACGTNLAADATIVLQSFSAQCGSEIASDAIRGTEIAYGGRRVPGRGLQHRASYGCSIALCPCYAVSGTDTVCAASIILCACYALSSTNTAYAAIALRGL